MKHMYIGTDISAYCHAIATHISSKFSLIVPNIRLRSPYYFDRLCVADKAEAFLCVFNSIGWFVGFVRLFIQET